jgi:hypothetical protein
MLLFSGISPISSLKYFSPGRRGLESQVRAGKFFGTMHGDSEEISGREAHRGNVLGLYNISHEIKGNRRAKRAEKCFCRLCHNPPHGHTCKVFPCVGFSKYFPSSPPTHSQKQLSRSSPTHPQTFKHMPKGFHCISKHSQNSSNTF